MNNQFLNVDKVPIITMVKNLGQSIKTGGKLILLLVISVLSITPSSNATADPLDYYKDPIYKPRTDFTLRRDLAEAGDFSKLNRYTAGTLKNANALNAVMEAFRKEAMANEAGQMIEGIVDAGWCYCRANALANILYKSELQDVELVGYAAFGDTGLLTYPSRARYPFTWHVAPVIRIKNKPSLVFVADPSVGFHTVPGWVDYFNGAVNRDSVRLSIIPLDSEVRLGPEQGRFIANTTLMYRYFRNIPSDYIPALNPQHVARDTEMVMHVKGIVAQGGVGSGREEDFVNSEQAAEEILQSDHPRMNLMKNEGVFAPEIAVCANSCGTCIVM